jgi:2-hydroxy-6-oxonona-2,4-dienedioate hydrolase
VAKPIEFTVRSLFAMVLVGTMLVLVEPAAGAASWKTVGRHSESGSSESTGKQRDKYATVSGAKIHYIEAGTGPTVVLLHGLGASTVNFVFSIDPLAQSFHVIALDQIGFGESDKPRINYRITTYVEFLDGFLKELKIERASLVGKSLGGWVAAAYALEHPQRVEGLVLVDAAGFAPPADFDMKQLSGLNPTTHDDMRKLLERAFYNKRLFASDLLIDESLKQRAKAGDGRTIQALIESISRREDMLDGRLGGIRHRTLIIWGREDEVLPLADGVRFRDEIPGAQLIVFDQCGHVPPIEKSSEFNAAVLKFLSAPAR